MDDLLDGTTRAVVATALVAYNAMETTKRRHFDYLNRLDSKRKKFNLEATAEDTQLLNSLLADHDIAVKNFKVESQRLQESAPDAHLALFRYVGMLNEKLGESSEPQAGSQTH